MHVGIGLVLVKNEPKVLLVLILVVVSLVHQIESPKGQKRETMRTNRKHEPMSNDAIQQIAPSAFAGQAHDTRSERYSFVPTSVIIDGMREHGFVPVYASQSFSRVAGKQFFTKHQIRFQAINNPVMNLGDVTAEVILTNSHDGTSRYELSCGLYRLACLNGMMVSTSFVESLKVRHVGNAVDLVIAGTEEMVKRAPSGYRRRARMEANHPHG